MGVVEEQLFQILSVYWKALCNLVFFVCFFNEKFILRTHTGSWNLKFQSCFSDTWLIEPRCINLLGYRLYIWIGKKAWHSSSAFPKKNWLPGSAIANHKMKVVIGKLKSCITNDIFPPALKGPPMNNWYFPVNILPISLNNNSVCF